MIEYGIALFVVCLLSFADKGAMPYALTLSAGWLLGFGPAEVWPVISLMLCAVTLFLYRRDGTWWGLAIHSLAVAMLLADVVYWTALVQGTYIGVEYAYALNAGLALQLILVGHRGVKSGWTGLLDWSRQRVFRPVAHARHRAEEA
jgi:hypothetical protein